MINLIAWRNVWRNKKRSMILISTIAFGLWAGLVSWGMLNGWVIQSIMAAVNTRTAHIQIHANSFREQNEIKLTIPDSENILQKVCSLKGIKAASGRSIVTGMAASAESGSGVRIHGIIPEVEKKISDVYTKIIDGTYFETKKRNPIVIGQKLADKLGVRVGQKIVLTAQSLDQSISAGAFRISGIFKSNSTVFDEGVIFARLEDLNNSFGLESSFHEIAIVTENLQDISQIRSEVQNQIPALEVVDWKDISPELALTSDMTAQMMIIFMIIIMLALVFGITNTMLMGVLERIRELGALIALGMKHRRIFEMILLETIYLSLVGSAIGLFVGSLTIALFGKIGIDLTMVAEGLEAFGYTTIIYTELPLREYFIVFSMVIVTAFISSVYPGLKASRLNPISAIRTY